ncbi:uncharacterized protein LOC141651861 [Silene latifolia]|uniref:uncharacterized protein LOC141651861 n=1 Tax=Silene latifolia TaxID=37657 RepID=UPI003D76E4E7
MRHGNGEKKTFTPGGLSFMESLTQSLQKTRLGIMENRVVEKGETSKSIHTKVFNYVRRKEFWFTVVYGMNKMVDREPLWDSLCKYDSGISGPWIVGGDFNAIMANNERSGGAPITNSEMRHLLQVTQDCQLTDLCAKGAFYTWNNKHEGGTKVYSRLDRVLINDECLDIFPDSYTHFLPEGMFDHCPDIIKFEMEGQRQGQPFEYYKFTTCGPWLLSIKKL